MPTDRTPETTNHPIHSLAAQVGRSVGTNINYQGVAMLNSTIALVGSVSLLTVPTIVACVSAVRYRRSADRHRDESLALEHAVSLLGGHAARVLLTEAVRFRRELDGDPQAKAERTASVAALVRLRRKLTDEDLDSYADEALRVVADGVQGLHETFDRGIDRLNGKVDEAERQIGGAR